MLTKSLLLKQSVMIDKDTFMQHHSMPTLRNWNHTVIYDVVDGKYMSPREVSEVQAIVKEAFENDIPVTVAGACHSTTACMFGHGINLSMQHFDRKLSVDTASLTVTAQAGVTLHRLCSYLRKNKSTATNYP